MGKFTDSPFIFRYGVAALSRLVSSIKPEALRVNIGPLTSARNCSSHIWRGGGGVRNKQKMC